MHPLLDSVRRRWPLALPVLALVVLAAAWGRDLPGWGVGLVALALGAAVISAVHHAEVVAHRVGEPFGSLVLAVAVTVIEVALIVTLMLTGGPDKATLARDTVFAAVMITCNGIVGVALLVATRGGRVARFNASGSGGALAAIMTLATLTLVLPTFTTSTPGPTFSAPQLAFAAVASLVLYGVFVLVQTVRHRDYFLPPATVPPAPDRDEDDTEPAHAAPPTTRAAVASLVLLLAALVAVVGLAKTISPALERAVAEAGLPLAVVGVAIALLVLLPESLAAVRAAARGQTQTGLNLAYGSAMASIGLTIPTIAVASLWAGLPLQLGLTPTALTLLAISAVVGILTVTPGRATVLNAAVHLSLLAGFLVLAVSP